MADLLEHPAVTRAKEIWAEREKMFPRFVQQTWEQGTHLAQRRTVWLAMAEMGLAPPLSPTPEPPHDL
jgi:hypothetical protein